MLIQPDLFITTLEMLDWIVLRLLLRYLQLQYRMECLTQMGHWWVSHQTTGYLWTTATYQELINICMHIVALKFYNMSQHFPLSKEQSSLALKTHHLPLPRRLGLVWIVCFVSDFLSNQGHQPFNGHLQFLPYQHLNSCTGRTIGTLPLRDNQLSTRTTALYRNGKLTRGAHALSEL